ncbi:MAG: hypothetical protein ACT4PL_04045 [Phycisphaerales bacterium]
MADHPRRPQPRDPSTLRANTPPMAVYPAPHHALVIGGTGMLRRVALHLSGPSGNAHDVSVIARSREDLDELARHAAPASSHTSAAAQTRSAVHAHPSPQGPEDHAPTAPRRGRLVGHAADYTNSPQLARALRAATEQFGPVSIILAYITAQQCPTTEREVLTEIAAQVGSPDDPRPLFHVRSSAAADPRSSPTPGTLINHPNILYRAITLGFVIEPRGSRWLTNDEIARGVLRAIRAGDPEATIGVTRPWTARPG